MTLRPIGLSFYQLGLLRQPAEQDGAHDVERRDHAIVGERAVDAHAVALIVHEALLAQHPEVSRHGRLPHLECLGEPHNRLGPLMRLTEDEGSAGGSAGAGQALACSWFTSRSTHASMESPATIGEPAAAAKARRAAQTA